MPLFGKKLTKEQKRTLDIKIQIAEDKPDSYYDLSECGISKIPEGVFSKIKILQKQALLLHHNLLEDFSGGGKLPDLSNLLILDISHNKFTQLPKTICQLTHLQKLVLSHNKLKRLPEEIGALKELQVLDVSDNQLGSLPATAKHFTMMESLNISNNVYLTQLNPSLCFMPHLKDFKFDQERITYPVKQITTKGIEEIQRWFRKLVGDEHFSEQSDGPSVSPPPKLYPRLPSDETAFEDAIIERELQREQHNKERMRLEQGIYEMQEDNAKYLANAQHEREQVLKEIERKHIENEATLTEQFNSEVANRNRLLEKLQKHDCNTEASTSKQLESQLKANELNFSHRFVGLVETDTAMFEREVRKRDSTLEKIHIADMEAEAAIVKKFEDETIERNKMLEELYLKNDHLDETVNFVMQMTERARHSEELLEELEEEQSRIDRLVEITVEEHERLRKQEIVEAMNMMMMENEQSKRIWNAYESQRNAEMKQSAREEEEDSEGLERVLHDTETAQHALLEQLMTEEEQQKKAFQRLQFQKDVKLNRLNKQLELVEAELAQLSLLEIQKRHEKREQEINTLAEMRIQTALLLSKLIDEQEKRENRLKNMVARMEEERQDDGKDYWLIQFQRLLDSKPQVLIDAENSLDAFVADTVLQAGCREYLPHFARHNIDETAMLEMTKEKLFQIGIRDIEAQDNIMASIKSVVLMNDHFMKRQNSYTGPSASKVNDDAVDLQPYAGESGRPLRDLCQESECVVCMDAKPEVVFLPCGHVCTCTKCCRPLKDCPICRQEIKQTFRLYAGT